MKSANIKGLEVFAKVMEEGTLSRAAQRMNLSQPAASRLLSILEEELDLPLFKRHRQRLVPTAAALRIHREAARIVSSMSDFSFLADDIRAGREMPLRVICNPRLMNGLIVPALASFLSVRPQVRVKLYIRPRSELEHGLIRERFDVGAGSLPVRNENIASDWIGESYLKVVMLKDHPLAARKSLSLSDLESEPYVAMGMNTIVRTIVDGTVDRSGIQLHPNVEASTAEATIRLVRLGCGFTIVDSFAIPRDLLDDLALVPFKPATPIGFGLFHLKDEPRHEASTDFSNAVRGVVSSFEE